MQVRPSPWNPGLHVHLKLPGEFTHSALTWQLTTRHSLISERKIQEENMVKIIIWWWQFYTSFIKELRVEHQIVDYCRLDCRAIWCTRLKQVYRLTNLPKQLKPLPVNPTLHLQVKLPTVFVHVAFSWQAFVGHSSLSESIEWDRGYGSHA